MVLPCTDILALALCTVLILCVRRRRARCHPPGPPGLPLIGNLFGVPTTNDSKPPNVTYYNWSRQYDSDIVRVAAMGMNIVVVHSIEAVKDLFERRSAIYSDRARAVMLNELSGFEWGLAFVRYGGEWRDMRRMAHQVLHEVPVRQYQVKERKSTNRFLVKLYRQPDVLMDNIRYLSACTIMDVAYDIDIKSLHDQYILTAEAAAESISETTNAGQYLVDFFPILKYVPEWIPGAGFKKRARLWSVEVEKLRSAPFEEVQRRLAAGELGDCAAKVLIDRFSKGAENPEYTESIIRSVLGSLYVAGADTTTSALGTFFLAMTLYPELQEKARKQIDQVVGSLRLPDHSDRPLLPYIDAIMREVLRWRPVLPLDVPHVLTEDDTYDGYYLPKGTLVIANSWAILNDEKMYPEPERFSPDRYLLPDGSLDPDVFNPADAAFGYGRRICPGRFMAQDSMWITMARVCSVFEIKKAVGEDGKEITPAGEYYPGFLRARSDTGFSSENPGSHGF
ncbi:cytochrome P450 [Daedaleopsis nitida]|nr:cytochrome P450 [Daedaleopsis nitida]